MANESSFNSLKINKSMQQSEKHLYLKICLTSQVGTWESVVFWTWATSPSTPSSVGKKLF